MLIVLAGIATYLSILNGRNKCTQVGSGAQNIETVTALKDTKCPKLESLEKVACNNLLGDRCALSHPFAPHTRVTLMQCSRLFGSGVYLHRQSEPLVYCHCQRCSLRETSGGPLNGHSVGTSRGAGIACTAAATTSSATRHAAAESNEQQYHSKQRAPTTPPRRYPKE